jgi:hypothetical protein
MRRRVGREMLLGGNQYPTPQSLSFFTEFSPEGGGLERIMGTDQWLYYL